MNWWRRWRNWLKLAYAGTASALCLFLAALYPADGPTIAQFIPANAAMILHVRSSEELHRFYKVSPVLAELYADEDIHELLGERPLEQTLEQAFEKLRGNAPWYAKGLVPSSPEDLYPIVGGEAAAVRLQPEANFPLLEKPKRPALLVFVRVSGVHGLALRVAAVFSPKLRNQFADLGGGLIAFSPGRPKPDLPAHPPAPGATPEYAWEADRLPLCSLMLIPAALDSPRAKRDTAPIAPIERDGLQPMGVPPSVVAAMLDPPAPAELLRVKPPPEYLRVDLFAEAGGGLSARGSISGSTPLPLPSQEAGTALRLPPAERQRVFGEVLAPLDAQACFLRFLERRVRKRELQSRFLLSFADMHEEGLDIDKQLWPACGNFLHATLGEPPPEDATDYPLLQARIPFDGSTPESHAAFGELLRAVAENYDKRVIDGSMQGMTSKYIRRIFQHDRERYVSVYGQILAPEITAGRHALFITSNAGFRALLEDEPADAAGTNSAQPPQPPRAASAAAAAPKAWFVHLDGVRLAPYVERMMTKYYDDREEEMTTRSFLRDYADSPLRIRASRKLARAFGRFSLDVTPQGNSARIDLVWTPGTLKGAELEEDDSAPPPPPPP